MVNANRLHADAEEAEIQSEMAKTRVRYAQASRAALTRRWHDAQEDRRLARQPRQDGRAIGTRRQPLP